MNEKELRKEMKSLIDEEGLGNETPWQRRMREAIQRDYEITRVLSSLVLRLPILLIAIVVGGIMMYSTFGWFATILWVTIIIVLLVFC